MAAAAATLLGAPAGSSNPARRIAITIDDLPTVSVSLEDALRDPAYRSADTYYGPAGITCITWLHW